MNHLEKLKKQLMVKPTVQERERVAVVIKGDRRARIKPDKEKVDADKTIGEELEEGVLNLGEQISEIQELQGILPVSVSLKETGDKIKRPLIVDETEKGYDIQTFLKKLEDNKKTKVSIKPETVVEEKEIEKPVLPSVKKAKKISAPKLLIIDEEDEVKEAQPEVKEAAVKAAAEEDDEEVFILKPKKRVEFKEEKKEQDVIAIIPPKKRERKTAKPEKGIAVLGPEVVVEMGDTNLTARLPKRQPPVIVKVSSYIMNNREIFVNFINSLFEPYKRELEENSENISCDTIGKTSSDFSLLTHQKIVRDYMNLYTPYRGLLLYHGLGSGKTCTSIAIAEGMKDSKNVIIMTPASLRANYVAELKKCGDLIYKKNQFWEWISIEENPEALKTMSAVLNLPQEYISKNGGAFFINIRKKSNYDELSDTNKLVLEQQLDEMIRQKYQFINYNGLRLKKLEQLTSGYTKNIFDNSVVVIDEAHNFISRIVNKLKKEKNIRENKRGEKERLPYNLSTKLYEMLLSAKNARIILLSGTPVINYPNEFGILFNILRGYIKTWSIPLVITTNKKIDKYSLYEMLIGEKTFDYLDYSPSSKILTITRNPFGFKNKVKKESGYQGVSNNKKNESGEIEFDTEVISDDDFERRIISILKRNDINVIPDGIEIKYRKALPDSFDEFTARFVDESTRQLKNADVLKRRILGLSSYFRSAQENLLPRFNKQLGVDYHIIRIPMSDTQFRIYESARVEERKTEKPNPQNAMSKDYEEKSSTYRIFSRLYCNFVIPERPIPTKMEKNAIELKRDFDRMKNLSQEEIRAEIDKLTKIGVYKGDYDELLDDYVPPEPKNKDKKKRATKQTQEEEEESSDEESNMVAVLKQGKKVESKQDAEDEREGEIEGDEVLEELGGTTYTERLQNKIKEIEEHSNDFLTPEALQTYSPKFLHILENIQDPAYQGLHLVYSQFRTAEGIGLFTLVLNKNGFTQFKITKNPLGLWEISIPEADEGKPTYALYTGTETVEEKEIVRKIYNGEWDDIPDSISTVLKSKYRNNNMGEVIKVFMITSSGSEGINLRNTRYVHLMDPYWHPVRSEQVIGRARRICSHKDLPVSLQTVEVFVYLMIFTESQLKSDEATELKRKDLSKSEPKVPITSDQYLFEISEIKAKLTNQLTEAIKESAFDCYLYSNGKCVNFGDPSIDKFSYVPDYTQQQNDTIVKANKMAIEWVGKPVTINGVKYVYRRISDKVINIYDLKSYEAALEDPSVIPVQVGTYETNERGQKVFKQLVV